MKKCMTNYRRAVTFVSFIFTVTLIGKALAVENSQVAIVTYISNNEQERSAKALVKSIRELSGKYKDSKIFIILGDPDNCPAVSLKGKNVNLVSLEMDSAFKNYPLAIKAFAASQVEKIVRDKVQTLLWMDPGVIVLNSPDALKLDENYDVAVRPVTLLNNIGLAPGEKPNSYWAPIYQENHLQDKPLPTIKTIADEVEIQPYYNCEVFSINPNLGICEKWAHLLTQLLKDENYQKTACPTFTRKLFLHQAILSGVISANIEPKRIKPLPITSGYPFNQHEKLPKEKQVSTLNELSVVIFDFAWAKNPTWMNKIPINEPLKQWLEDTYQEYLN
ncbi:MAG: hypothetical protein PHW79_06550 [Candidatus Marinimicrobia bacterium]|nr:hypothetical protein [Candidatus Neomarinimicrobiota bacterium]